MTPGLPFGSPGVEHDYPSLHPKQSSTNAVFRWGKRHRLYGPLLLPTAIKPKRDAHNYCAVTAIVTLCVIVPEVAVIVRFDVVGVVVAAMLAGDSCDEEHPAIPARATTNRRRKNDPRAMIDRRLRPAKASSPIGPMNERLMPAGEWNRLATLWVALRS